MMNVVKLGGRPVESAIEYARNLLARCESGEVIAITAIEFRRNAEYMIGGSAVENRLETAGALLEAAMDRLK